MSVTVIKNVFAEEGAKKGAKRSILETCIKVHAQATALAPVDFGQLKNSLMYTVADKEAGFNSQGGESAPSSQKITSRPKELEGYVGTNSDHWYPEFGTRYQVAQPFLRPAGEIVAGSNPGEVVKKYCREAMLAEYAKRKVVKL